MDITNKVNRKRRLAAEEGWGGARLRQEAHAGSSIRVAAAKAELEVGEGYGGFLNHLVHPKPAQVSRFIDRIVNSNGSIHNRSAVEDIGPIQFDF